jgi:lipopolysaccharide/colanic/teichoic acid biosynthesis glycosyltransferase
MLKLDVAYVRSRSLRSDVGILLRTMPALMRSGAR